jgi:hypothetical protein
MLIKVMLRRCRLIESALMTLLTPEGRAMTKVSSTLF